MAQVLSDAKIRPLVRPPAGVEAVIRRNDERGLLFLINHTPEQQTVGVPESSRELLTDTKSDETLKLEPFGIAVLEVP